MTINFLCASLLLACSISANITDGYIYVPSDIELITEEAEADFGICAEVLQALAMKESRFNQDAVSSDGTCVGICQIKTSCHKERINRMSEYLQIDDIYHPYLNIYVAADYLKELLDKYDDIGIALMRYNGLSETKCFELVENGKLSKYAETILTNSEKLELQKEKEKTMETGTVCITADDYRGLITKIIELSNENEMLRSKDAELKAKIIERYLIDSQNGKYSTLYSHYLNIIGLTEKDVEIVIPEE